MQIYKSNKFTMDTLLSQQLTPESIFDIVPIRFESSHLIGAVLSALEDYSVPVKSSAPRGLKSTIFDLDSSVTGPNSNSMKVPLHDTSYSEAFLDSFVEKQEEFCNDQHRWQGWLRVLIKEQAKLNMLSSTKKNATESVPAPPTIDEDIQAATQNVSRLQTNEHSRLDSLLYTNQINSFAAKAADYSDVTKYKIELAGKL